MNSNFPKIHGNKKITTEIFIEKAQKIHGDKYSYAKSSYSQYHNKLIITCTNHCDFQQSPYLHLRGSGCSLCYGNERLTTNQFIEKARKIHGDKYDYTSTVYKNNKTKVNISCSIHGEFYQRPTRHLNGDGCPKCGIILAANKNKDTRLEFIQKVQKRHNGKYDYSLVEYIHCEEKVKIICPVHGIFFQIPSKHTYGIGCPYCNDSKGEIKVKNFLEINNIDYIRNKTFDDCLDINKLRFDFYLPILNTLIEFDGIQHYKPIKAFGGEKEFINIQRRDKIKNEYCNNNSIPLIRIRYNEIIENKLNVLL